jgi:hypothetical protein
MILMNLLRLFLFVLSVARDFAVDALGLALSSFRSRTALLAENLFLRKQLAFYQERQIRPRRLERGSALFGLLVTVLCLEIGSSYRQARNPDRVASQGIPAVLEAEVEAGETANPTEIAPTD